MAWILDKVKLWNFHYICQENDGLSIAFGLIFDQTAVKRYETIRVTFFTEDFTFFEKIGEFKLQNVSRFSGVWPGSCSCAVREVEFEGDRGKRAF